MINFHLLRPFKWPGKHRMVLFKRLECFPVAVWLVLPFWQMTIARRVCLHLDQISCRCNWMSPFLPLHRRFILPCCCIQVTVVSSTKFSQNSRAAFCQKLVPVSTNHVNWSMCMETLVDWDVQPADSSAMKQVRLWSKGTSYHPMEVSLLESAKLLRLLHKLPWMWFRLWKKRHFCNRTYFPYKKQH